MSMKLVPARIVGVEEGPVEAEGGQEVEEGPVGEGGGQGAAGAGGAPGRLYLGIESHNPIKWARP